MNVTEYSETDRTVELRITDPSGTRHRLTLTKDGQITSHWSDRYGSDDSSLRVQEQLARVERFAKYYLLRTTQYSPLAPYSRTDQIADPDRLAVTALLLGTMATDTLSSHLQSCYEQLTALRTNDDPPVAPPQAAPNAEWQRLEQDIHLTIDLAESRRLAEALVELNGLAKIRRALDVRPDRADADLFERLNRILSTHGVTADEAISNGQFLRVISPLRVHWRDGESTRVEYGNRTEPDGDATLAARIQLTPAHTPVISMDAFQRTLVDHLRCQIRDCYVGMGLRPPSDAQVTGRGIAACTDRYERIEGLQRYHDEHAIIDWTGLASRPDL